MRSPIREVANIVEKEATPEEVNTIEIVQRKSAHFKLSLIVNGKKLNFSCPCSPSDRRWALNWRADFRRAYRQAKAGGQNG